METKIITINGKRIAITKNTFAQGKESVAQVMLTRGFNAVAREIRKAKTTAGIKRQGDYVMKRELKTGSFGPYLYDPIARKKIKNPVRAKGVELNKKLNQVYKMMEASEKMK
jgi:hypothetical protein